MVGMTIKAEQTTKIQCMHAFAQGELDAKRKAIYDRDDYWSQGASHRLKMVLRSVDYHSVAKKGLALDVGIGGRCLLRELIWRKYRVFGADLSWEMALNGSLSASELNGDPLKRVVVADVESLLLQSDRFYLTTCLGVMEYLSADKAAFSEF
jgi:SAM-dependent methyltransferase